MKPPNLSRMILEQVRMEVEDEWNAPREVGTFRASEVGDCPRRIQYFVEGYQREPVHPELALLFRDGHLHHHDLRSNLRRVGRLTNEEHATWKRYTVGLDGVGEVSFILTGTTDGIFNRDFIIDIKSINHFSFQRLTKEYVKEKHHDYVVQVQMYMDLFNKEWACLLFKNKMTSALKEIWFRKNQALIDKALIKLAKIHVAVMNKKKMKRPYSKNSRECKLCPMRIHCWKIPTDKRRWE